MKKLFIILAMAIICILSTAACATTQEVSESANVETNQIKIEKIDLSIEAELAKYSSLGNELKYIKERAKTIQTEANEITVKIRSLQDERKTLEAVDSNTEEEK